MPEGSGQMIDEGAHYRRQATTRCEDEVDDAVLRAPLREDMRQCAARKFASTSVVRQERHAKSGHCGVAKRQEIDTGHPRLMSILQQHLRGARLILYPDSGHGSHFQFPEEFAEEAARSFAAA
jgi:pimeloyl-ACP methyl ester carboxylesterase